MTSGVHRKYRKYGVHRKYRKYSVHRKYRKYSVHRKYTLRPAAPRLHLTKAHFKTM